MKNLIGQKFNMLTVVEYYGKTKRGMSRWKCLCDCGNIKIITIGNLKNGNTKSCGCLRKEGNRLIHGHNKVGMGSKIYMAWSHMKQRCNNPNDKRYKDYGGRGIIICKRWLKFENFLEDMGECLLGLSLDRINNNLGYYKENCRWATRKQQNRNTRKNIYLTHNNKTQLLLDWAKEYNINYTTLYNRIYICNWSIKKALTTPVKKQNR